MRRNLCRPIPPCAIPRSKTAAASCHTSPARQDHPALHRPEQRHGGTMRSGLIDVLEGNYGGDITKMPYVVNKEAFAKT